MDREVMLWNDVIDAAGYRDLVKHRPLAPATTPPSVRAADIERFRYMLRHCGVSVSGPAQEDFFESAKNWDMLRDLVVAKIGDKSHASAAKLVRTMSVLVSSTKPELSAVLRQLAYALDYQRNVLYRLQCPKTAGLVPWEEAMQRCRLLIDRYGKTAKSERMTRETKYHSYHQPYLLAHFLLHIAPMRRKPLCNAYMASADDGPEPCGNHLRRVPTRHNAVSYVLVVRDDKKLSMTKKTKEAGAEAGAEFVLDSELSKVVHDSFQQYPRRFLFQTSCGVVEPVSEARFDALLRECTGMTTNLVRASFSTYWRVQTEGKTHLSELAARMRTSVSALDRAYVRPVDYYERRDGANSASV